MTDVRGQCLCGAVRFRARIADGNRVTACHCGQCRRWVSGGPFMAMHLIEMYGFDADETLSWYRSSETGERGFCTRCGTSLFWRAPGTAGDWGVAAGSLVDVADLTLVAHIWVDDQPPWYAFADDAPRMTGEGFAALVEERDG